MARIRQKELCQAGHSNFPMYYPSRTGLPPFSITGNQFKEKLENHFARNSLPSNFLLQALYMNGYLHPSVISALADGLVQKSLQARISGDPGPPVLVEAFERLFM